MRSKRHISLAVSVFMAVVMALILPGIGSAGSLDPPAHAVDGSGNPVPTTLPKFACRGAFMSNENGTVTDCKTGIIWMRNAECFGQTLCWLAEDMCSALHDGSCGVNDGSSAGDWRLPTIEELMTMPDRTYTAPTLSNAKGDAQWTEGDAFNNVQSTVYWSSTIRPGSTNYQFGVSMKTGVVYNANRDWGMHYVWCVRGGR